MVRDGAVRPGGDDGLEGRVAGAQLDASAGPGRARPRARSGRAGSRRPRSARPAPGRRPRRPARSASISPASLTARSVSTRSAVGTRFDAAAVRQPRGQQAQWSATVTDLASNPTTPSGARRQQRQVAGPGDQPGQVGHLVCRLRGVPAVGAEQGAGRRSSAAVRVGDGLGRRLVVGGDHQQRRVRSGEPGQVADVDQIGDQQRVDAGAASAARRSARRWAWFGFVTTKMVGGTVEPGPVVVDLDGRSRAHRLNVVQSNSRPMTLNDLHRVQWVAGIGWLTGWTQPTNSRHTG